MFTFKKSQLPLFSLPQTKQESDAISEQEAMLDHEYHAREVHPQNRRLWSSNVPWIFTTIALTIYISVFKQPLQDHRGPWSPTDAGKSLLAARKDHFLLTVQYLLVL